MKALEKMLSRPSNLAREAFCHTDTALRLYPGAIGKESRLFRPQKRRFEDERGARNLGRPNGFQLATRRERIRKHSGAPASRGRQAIFREEDP